MLIRMTRRHSLAFFSLLTIASGFPVTVVAASGGRHDDVHARYQAEATACRQMPAMEERTACLREAAAARNEALKGQLGDTPDMYERNALARCNALPRSEQDLCARRTRGEGVVSGSVSDGGVYREYKEITVPDSVQTDPVIVPPASTSGQ